MGVKERRKFNQAPLRLCSRKVVVNGLRFFGITIVIWGELGTFFWSLSSCRWPDSAFSGSDEKPTHVLLISDPQVRHPSAIWGEKSWLGSLRQFVFDSNLKKNWHVTTRLNPHVVIFLGDMLATGKFAKSELEHEQYSRKFKSIFPSGPSTQVYYIPGNNDIGMGISPTFSTHVRRHYSKNFSPFNMQVSIRNHTFVLLDAPGLVDEDYQRTAHGVGYDRWTPIHEGAVEFVKTVPADEQPVILFSHIPLARPDTASCGPLRERGTIRRGVGHGYQNTLGKQTTAFLLQTLRPSAIFSGDNRDYCELTHTVTSPDRESTLKTSPIREVTVKSFSMTSHIRRPGFQLLSLITPQDVPSLSTPRTFADTPCLLPDQYGVYSGLYMPLALFGLFLLFVSNLYRSRYRTPTIVPISLSPHDSNHSGQSSPVLRSESAIWSTFSPVSPMSNLPPSLRTPKAQAGPTFRAASHPSTPHGSPLLSPMIFPHDEEDDEAMYPPQYLISRGHANGDWSSGHDEDLDRDRTSYFVPAPAPGWKPVERHAWSWSRTFVFRGRRRRITLRAPSLSLSSLQSLLKSVGEGASSSYSSRRRNAIEGTLIDGFSVLWPAWVIWGLITWWMA